MQNPKVTLIRAACKALAPTFRRTFAEIGRTLVNPRAGEPLVGELARSMLQALASELGKNGLPVVTPEQPVPAGAHWLVEPLGSRINALHGRLPVSVNIAFVAENSTCPLGAVYFPVEDVLALAELGTGASGPERLKVSGRTTLEDAVLLLPRTTEAALALNLLPLAAQHHMHPRKTGHNLFDALDVAAGRADIWVGTGLSRLEALLATLILGEAGALATDLAGHKPGATTTALLAANLKLHPQMLAALGGRTTA